MTAISLKKALKTSEILLPTFAEFSEELWWTVNEFSKKAFFVNLKYLLPILIAQAALQLLIGCLYSILLCHALATEPEQNYEKILEYGKNALLSFSIGFATTAIAATLLLVSVKILIALYLIQLAVDAIYELGSLVSNSLELNNPNNEKSEENNQANKAKIDEDIKKTEKRKLDNFENLGWACLFGTLTVFSFLPVPGLQQAAQIALLVLATFFLVKSVYDIYQTYQQKKAEKNLESNQTTEIIVEQNEEPKPVLALVPKLVLTKGPSDAEKAGKFGMFAEMLAKTLNCNVKATQQTQTVNTTATNTIKII